jgi:hypothetical protein
MRSKRSESYLVLFLKNLRGNGNAANPIMRRIASFLTVFLCFAGVSLADLFVYTFTGIPGSSNPTITQRFDYTAPAAITVLTDLNVAHLDFSSNVSDTRLGYGVEFDPLDTRFGFNTNADVIRVGISSSAAAFYYFPVNALTTPGMYASIGPASNNVGTLTVSNVPEPASIVFLGTIVAILGRRGLRWTIAA